VAAVAFPIIFSLFRRSKPEATEVKPAHPPESHRFGERVAATEVEIHGLKEAVKLHDEKDDKRFEVIESRLTEGFRDVCNKIDANNDNINALTGSVINALTAINKQTGQNRPS
jgi:hypothetical protein